MRQILLVLVLLSAVPAVYADPQEKVSVPADIPGVTPEMRTAGFWINRHPYPDKLVMNPSQVLGLNEHLVRQGLILDLSAFPENYDGRKLKKEIADAYSPLKKRALFLADGSAVAPSFFESLESAMHLEDIPASVEPRYGFIVARVDERLAPADTNLNAQAGDIDFDEAQNSGLDIATPVIVLHQTRDGAWFFVKDAIASGWVKAERVALVSRDDLLSYVKRRDIVVVVAPETDIYLDRQLTKHYGSVKMGARFVLKNSLGRAVEVLLPQKRSGFLASREVNAGFLAFTPRTIYEQAFKMLDKPYGWGDMNGGQDCSRFIQMVFATVGLTMPRNSSEQRQVGVLLDGFKDDLSVDNKEAYLVGDGVGALTILGLKGHIMLYLGEVEEKPYAIHATWSYKEKMPDGQGERTRLVQRVAVTGLDLGAGSAKGSLLERIISIRLIEK